MRRTLSPTSFIQADTEGALASLPIYAWDVMPAATFLSAIGASDRMLVNRWLYRDAEGTPPFEPQGKWRAGRGGTRVVRKDRAMAWARSGGLSPPAEDCWRYATSDLSSLGWPNLGAADEVQDILDFLFDHYLIKQAIRLKDRRELRFLYRDQRP